MPAWWLLRPSAPVVRFTGNEGNRRSREQPENQLGQGAGLVFEDAGGRDHLPAPPDLFLPRPSESLSEHPERIPSPGWGQVLQCNNSPDSRCVIARPDPQAA